MLWILSKTIIAEREKNKYSKHNMSMASQFIDIGQEYLCTYSKLSHFVPYPLFEFNLNWRCQAIQSLQYLSCFDLQSRNQIKVGMHCVSSTPFELAALVAPWMRTTVVLHRFVSSLHFVWSYWTVDFACICQFSTLFVFSCIHNSLTWLVGLNWKANS